MRGGGGGGAESFLFLEEQQLRMDDVRGNDEARVKSDGSFKGKDKVKGDGSFKGNDRVKGDGSFKGKTELGAMVALRATRGKDKRPELDSDLMYVLLMPPSGKL